MLFPMLSVLHFDISTFRSMCALPSTAVLCSSLISPLPGLLIGYFLNDFDMVPIAVCYHWCLFSFYIPLALYVYCTACTF